LFPAVVFPLPSLWETVLFPSLFFVELSVISSFIAGPLRPTLPSFDPFLFPLATMLLNLSFPEWKPESSYVTRLPILPFCRPFLLVGGGLEVSFSTFLELKSGLRSLCRLFFLSPPAGTISQLEKIFARGLLFCNRFVFDRFPPPSFRLLL